MYSLLNINIRINRPSIVVHACNPSTGEAKAGGSRVLRPALSYTVSPCLKKRKKKKSLPNPEIIPILSMSDKGAFL
jgi:hypothetical protein